MVLQLGGDQATSDAMYITFCENRPNCHGRVVDNSPKWHVNTYRHSDSKIDLQTDQDMDSK